nr:MAG TPA: terminase small subunit [Caudoviricetes sp.]
MTEKKNPDEKKKRGRKSEYQKEYADQALKLCLLGATDKELAEFFSVSEQTLNKWKKDYPEFLESLKKGKSIADANVASRLYNRAIGYACKATKFAASEGKITDAKEYTEHYPPDTTAAIFWLKNRQPEKWRDKKEVDTNVNLGDELESLTDEQLQAIIDGKEED